MSSRFSETFLPRESKMRKLAVPPAVMRRSMVIWSPMVSGRYAAVVPVFQSVTATRAPAAPVRIRCFAVAARNTAHLFVLKEHLE